MTTGDRIRKARLAAGYKTQMALAKAIAVSQPTISDWESGKMLPSGEHLARLTAGVNCSPGWILFGDEAASEAAPDALNDLSLVPELDLRAISGLGGSSLEVTKENVDTVTRARYGFPEEHFRQIFGVGTGMADIAEVVGDSMYPTLIPGEKVVLNRADRIPSPPGIFVVWDGLGLVMKRVSFAPHSNPPMVRIASDNPAYEPYDRSLDEAHILARVVGKFSRTG